jgi:vacuolar-type H+-ATPase subunit I/STV1
VNTENALDALTDIALFIAVYVGVLSTVFAVGEPQTRGEIMGRVIALWMCAVAGAVLIVWLVIAILIRLGLIAHVG